MQHNIKELKKLVAFLRKNGISKYKSGQFEIELGKLLPVAIGKTGEQPEKTEGVPFPSWDSLTAEQKLLWSSTPINENA